MKRAARQRSKDLRACFRMAPSKKPLTTGWGATVIRVYKYTVLVKFNTEPKPFSVLMPHIDTVRPLRAGDELLIRIQQLPAVLARKKKGKRGS